MRLTSLLFLSLFILIEAPFAQDRIGGKVYDDQNKNLMLDEGEPGVAGVAVSNGREVIVTDEQGNYTLPVGNDDIIFVIKPSGYNVPLNSRRLPQFFYIHKPEGSPDLRYKGVDPTGPVPESVNFPLIKRMEAGQFKILVFGDPQPYTEQEVEYFDRDIISELAGAGGYAFGISLGDLVGDDLDLYDPYTRSVARVGIPWFNVMGNHDMNYDAESDRYADETFESTFGPATYAFNFGDVHFIILDDIIYPRKEQSGYIGGLTDEQLRFLENDLKHVSRDKLVVMAFHIPLFWPNENRETFRREDRNRLFEILKDYPNTLTLSAHTHIQQMHYFDKDEGWMRETPHLEYNAGTTSGDWWSGVPDDRGIPPTLMRDGTPNGYATITFEGNRFTIDYKVANADTSMKMSMWGPRVVPQNSWHSADLYVNYFLGSDRTNVEYRIPGQEWRVMRKSEESDPFVSALRQKWDTAETVFVGKRPSNPVRSTHLWKTRVPNDLPLGTQTLEIRVTDMFGRTFQDTFTYEVVPAEDEQ